MEFKGTKGKTGKWKPSFNHNGDGKHFIKREGEPSAIALCYDNNGCVNGDESMYNAQLIAHAPELLEMLNRVRLGEFPEQEIKDLIQRATNIND